MSYKPIRYLYPAGMLMPGRSYTAGDECGYRFGFNGKENVDEVNAIDYGARIRDPRLIPWMSVDPLQAKYPNVSPYNFAINCPISVVDFDGRDITLGLEFQKSEKYMNSLRNLVFYSGSFRTNIDKYTKSNEVNIRFESDPDVSTISGQTQHFVDVGGNRYQLKNGDYRRQNEFGGLEKEVLSPAELTKEAVFTVVIFVADKQNMTEGVAMETIVHEIALHTVASLKLIEDFKSGKISSKEFIEQSKTATDRKSELNTTKQHDDFVQVKNSLFNKIFGEVFRSPVSGEVRKDFVDETLNDLDATKKVVKNADEKK